MDAEIGHLVKFLFHFKEKGYIANVWTSAKRWSQLDSDWMEHR